MFSAPKSINIADPILVWLWLNAGEEIKRERGHGANHQTGSAEVRFGQWMEAEIMGSDFEPTKTMGPAKQDVLKKEYTEWGWELEPKDTGPGTLHITFSESEQHVVHRFPNVTIEVDATWRQRAGMFYAEHSGVIVGAILTGMFALLGWGFKEWWNKRG